MYKRKSWTSCGRVGLPESEKLAAAYPHRLSGGMCQWVMIAMGILGEPKLLIADEPTIALDLTTKAQIVQLLKRINRELGTCYPVHIPRLESDKSAL